MSGEGVRWPDGIVPYEISPGYCMYHSLQGQSSICSIFSFLAAADQTTIVNAMRQLENSVAINNVRCVQFRPREVDDVYYITIISGSGCSSYVSR